MLAIRFHFFQPLKWLFIRSHFSMFVILQIWLAIKSHIFWALKLVVYKILQFFEHKNGWLKGLTMFKITQKCIVIRSHGCFVHGFISSSLYRFLRSWKCNKSEKRQYNLQIFIFIWYLYVPKNSIIRLIISAFDSSVRHISDLDFFMVLVFVIIAPPLERALIFSVSLIF